MAANSEHFLGQLLRAHDKVDAAGGDRAFRHTIEFGRRWLLRHRNAASSLDLLQPLRAIGSRPRQDYRDYSMLMLLSERAKQDIDRLVRPFSTFAGTKMQNPIGDSHGGVRRDHVKMIWLHGRAVR